MILMLMCSNFQLLFVSTMVLKVWPCLPKWTLQSITIPIVGRVSHESCCRPTYIIWIVWKKKGEMCSSCYAPMIHINI